ncbi:MAG: CDC27 family protein [Campylobacteraceae bacterium]|jgi:tetratricopeptide (TPR) repeat protein|nr:CDC27 family protein [Campylobacteraceae bacterium]
MLKTEEVLILEEQWKEFKNKKIFKKIIIFFSILLSALLIVLLYLVLNASSKNDAQIDNASLNASVNETETKPANATNATASNNITTENNSVTDKKSKENETVVKPIINLPNITYIGPQVFIEPPEEKKIIIETNSIQNINELIKKFENTNNIIFANMISEEFYEKKNYKKSLEFALKANEIDSKNELSWIMFAKSQVKLGKKDDAIKALEVFIKTSKSAQGATNLLQKIKNGEFR